MSDEAYVPIVGRTRTGETVWYTGRAGEAFVSPDPKQAFKGYPLDSARRVATQLNRYTALHGVLFVACVGDLAKEVG